MVSPARIVAVAHSVPAPAGQDALWHEHFAACYGGDRRAERLWRSCDVVTRHGVVDPRVVDVSEWSTAQRMQRYVADAGPLAKDATAASIGESGLDATDIGLLAVVSCTGYATPGLDITLARDLGMSATTQRLLIGHMGCYAAIPGLSVVSDFTTLRGRPSVLLCCELPSLHVQPSDPEAVQGKLTRTSVEQLVAHALFADAAAAAVLATTGAGLQVVDIEACTDTTSSDLMTWDVTDHGFRMGLSPRVPDVLASHVAPVVDQLLARNSLVRREIAGWAVHPGGPRVVDVVGAELGLDGVLLTESRDVLRNYGNCSSATVLLVIERLLAAGTLRDGDSVVALAFGPGLTLYAALLRFVGGQVRLPAS